MRFAVPVLPRPQGPAKRTWPIPVQKCTEVLRKLAWPVRGAPIVSVTPGRYSRLKRYAHDRSCSSSMEMWVRWHADQRFS